MTTILRYYQSLLKSIPATLQTAEEQINQKTRLSGLPDTNEAILQIINQQQELATRIERHIEFFIKWDEQTELNLPQALKTSLRQMPQYISKYLEILALQSDCLKTKNTLKYLVFFEDEQKLHEEMSKLFDKTPFTKPTRSSTLHNLLYSFGKTLTSPIAKMIHLAFLIIVISFPSAVMPVLPVIQPNQGRISAPAISARKFAETMNLRGWKCRIDTETNSYAPTIIIKEDEHGTPEPESEFVEQALREYNINLLAVEGWAGERQDTERGYTILNAEEDFLKSVLKDSRFFKAGLEDADLQENCLRLHAIYQYSHSQQTVKKQEQELKNNQERLQQLIKEKEEKEKKLATCSEDLKDEILSTTRGLSRIIKVQEKQIEFNQRMISEFTKYRDAIMNETNRRAKELGLNPQTMTTTYRDLFEKDTEELKLLNEQVAVNQRSELWAQKIAALASRHQSIIVVMGRGHTESFLNSLKKLGEYNIVIVEPYQ